MNAKQKQIIYRQTCALYESWYGPDHGERGSCLYWTFAAGTVLMRHGIRPVVQAGSVCWPMNPIALPPDPIYFGYRWDAEDSVTIKRMAAGMMPELHVWLGLVDTQEIIDFSVRYFPQQAKTIGLEWRNVDPPEFLWATEHELPNEVWYAPDRDATRYVVQTRMKELLNENNSSGLGVRIGLESKEAVSNLAVH